MKKSKAKPPAVFNFVVKNDFNVGGAHADKRKKKPKYKDVFYINA